MLHIVKCDNPALLPFAKNCISRIKAAGLGYGSQKFDTDMGAVRVEVRPEGDYIWIEGGGGALEMDSGLADIGGYIIPYAPAYLDGTLYETAYVTDYTASFAPTLPASRWRKSDAVSSQIVGLLTHTSSRFKGNAPYDGMPARSFSAGHLKNEVTGEVTRNSMDDTLALKKIVAALVSPSVFTGRCRLYVQALYGRPLYEKEKLDLEGNGLNADENTYIPGLGPNVGNNIAPSLMLNPYANPGDTAIYGKVELTTSSGVYFDKMTGTHWLLCVPAAMSSYVEIYPLRASAAAETLREYLKETSTALNAKDKAHLEAFVLSRCLPDVAHRQTAGAITTVGTWSMGFGWHWNWSGTIADTVVTIPFEQAVVLGEHFNAMESSHYRITMTHSRTSSGAIVGWGCSFEILVSSQQWALPRGAWCIAEPDWSNMLLNKATPDPTIMFAYPDTPFYAFYVGDELKLCKASAVVVPAPDPVRTSSPEGFAGPTPFSFVAGSLEYGSSGVCEDWNPGPDHYAVTLTCGDLVAPDLPATWARGGQKYAINNIVWDGTYGSTSTPSSAWGLQVLPDGRQFLGYIGPPDSGVCTFERVLSNNANEEFTSNATIVIPPNDAEAIFFRVLSTRKTWTGVGEKLYGTTLGAYGWEWVRRYNAYLAPTSGSTPVPAEFVVYGVDAISGHSGAGYTISIDTAHYEPEVVTTVQEFSKLVCHAGHIDVTWSSLDQFHGLPDDLVIADFTTTSSTRDAVISKMRISPTNCGPADTPVFVGWA